MTKSEAKNLDTRAFRSALIDIDGGIDNDVPENVIVSSLKALHTLDAIRIDDRIPRGGLKAVAICAAYVYPG